MQSAPVRFPGLDAARAVTIPTVVMHHVYQAAGSPTSLDAIIRIRDFGFPVIIMTAYVAMTMALAGASDSGRFLRRRLWRLGVPFLAWTVIYCGIHAALSPWLESGRWFSLAVLVTGYVHLWFLSFLLIGTVVATPIMAAVLRRGALVSFGALACAMGVAYAAFVGPTLNQAMWQWDPGPLGPDMRIFLTQATANAGYVPLGCGLGALLLAAQRTGAPWKAPDGIAWLLVIPAFALHMFSGTFITRLVFSVAVFLALLQPPSWFVTHRWIRAIAAEAYAIYLLHFGAARLAPEAIALTGAPVNAGTVVLSAVVIFAGTFAVAYRLRQWGRLDWLLPSTAGLTTRPAAPPTPP